MKETTGPRHLIILLVLISALFWSLSSAGPSPPYPNPGFLTTPGWVHAHMNDTNLIIADVRSGDHYTGGVIPGAVHLPWSEFRINRPSQRLASVFVGVDEAQSILGRHGITPRDTVVLYDSVARDGGATASYLFWVLDLLGHENKKILEQGIDGWQEAGFDVAAEARVPDPLLYQAPPGKMRVDTQINGTFVYSRLGDPFYQIIDVRSKGEYLGGKGTKGLDGTPLKLGHIPTAVNINYTAAWTDPDRKSVKTYGALQDLYRGIDPARGVIVYCNSGRRSSFSYFILRLMGFEQVYTYEASWKEWGNPDKFFPVETRENLLTDRRRPHAPGSRSISARNQAPQTTTSGSGSAPDDGYISCGG